jgi:uncharacterized protein YjcR
MARLSDHQKTKLYKDWLTGNFSLFQLAQKYGVSQATVSTIIGRKLKSNTSIHLNFK